VRKILLDPGNKALDPSAELLLCRAAQHLKEVIRPALESGAMTGDRFSDATIAYQATDAD
jgi:thymidylate kinase